jgi:hypothetical protein
MEGEHQSFIGQCGPREKAARRMAEQSSPDANLSVRLQHSAVDAWNRLCSKTVEASLIEVLYEAKKSQVYRLHGLGPGRTPVIAKRCIAPVEQIIYKDILAHLLISSLTFYGYVEEPGTEYGWLFLGDAGGEEFRHSIEEHRKLAARWLAQLHVSAANMPALSLLPDRGPNYYLGHLRFARDLIETNLADSALDSEDRQVIEAIMSQGRLLESKWDRVKELYNRFPQTLVHCDFAKYNLRIWPSTIGMNLVAFDWEMAGRGAPAPDIAELSGRGIPRRQRVNSSLPDTELLDYWSVVREAWPHLDLATTRKLAELGAVFRSLAAISWESESIRRGWWPIKELHVYEVDLAVAIEQLGLV